jgi:hypothetical protein
MTDAHVVAHLTAKRIPKLQCMVNHDGSTGHMPQTTSEFRQDLAYPRADGAMCTLPERMVGAR